MVRERGPLSPQVQGAPQVGCCSARPGQRGTGPAPPAAPAPGSWTGSGQECQECGAAVSFPLLFLPPHREQDIPCPGKPAAIPFMGKPHALWWAPLLPWDGHSVQERLGGLAPRGSTRRACAGWMFVEDLLRTLCFIHRLILNLTNPIRFSLPGEETETRRGQGTCLRVPAGKCQRQTWSKPV